MCNFNEQTALIEGQREILLEIADAHLKHYCYTLRDPRDNKVFYVGEGQNDRVLSHFNEALQAHSGKREFEAKTRRIIEIWSAGEHVNWQIVSRGHEHQRDSQLVESAIMEAVSGSQNGSLLNKQAGQHGSTHGLVTPEDLQSLAATPVNPSCALDRVFVFPIHSALAEVRTPYEATRCCWDVATHWRDKESVAVGVAGGIARGSWRIGVNDWKQRDNGKWRFDGEEFALADFSNARWLQVINAARGYWQRGNFLVVSFDGRGNFKILRGSSSRESQPLI